MGFWLAIVPLILPSVANVGYVACPELGAIGLYWAKTDLPVT